MFDLLIKNGTIVFSTYMEEGDLAIKDGKIVAIGKELEMESCGNLIDAKGKYVMAGMIDTHFHASDPGGIRADWEGFVTGTKALAAGGTTSYIDMPLNNLPATVDKATFLIKKENAIGKNYVDYGFFGGLVPWNRDHLHELAEEGALAYKCFMATCGSPEIEGDFANVDDYQLYKGMVKLRELDQMLCIHAENPSVTDGLAKEYKAAGKTNPIDYARTRPIWTEVDAVQRAILMAKETGCRVHFMHISSAQSVKVIMDARAEGYDITLESCPHYFLLSEQDLEKQGAKCKCSPPLRDEQEQELLWKELLKGNISVLSSDHSPCPFPMKNHKNIFDAWGGIAGCQNNVDLMFEEAVMKRGMDICQFSRVISTNPARLYGIENKGELAIGYDADIILIDPNKSYVIEDENLYYRNQFTPYTGKKVNCKVTHTFVRGHMVYEDGKGILGEPIGQFIKKKEEKPCEKQKKIGV